MTEEFSFRNASLKISGNTQDKLTADHSANSKCISRKSTTLYHRVTFG